MTPQQYKETREKEFEEEFQLGGFILDFDGELRKRAAERLKHFHTASLDGLLDIIEKWANRHVQPTCYCTGSTFECEHWGRHEVINELLTFIGRDTK